ncbi:unnamed protein product [Ilex paraguariensis]|uniref:Transmembrane protein n=1 Tax=Ilex paraguariensis TaxID=185542 RepID=A0ABC8UYS3_9AQUA
MRSPLRISLETKKFFLLLPCSVVYCHQSHRSTTTSEPTSIALKTPNPVKPHPQIQRSPILNSSNQQVGPPTKAPVIQWSSNSCQNTDPYTDLRTDLNSLHRLFLSPSQLLLLRRWVVVLVVGGSRRGLVVVVGVGLTVVLDCGWWVIHSERDRGKASKRRGNYGLLFK